MQLSSLKNKGEKYLTPKTKSKYPFKMYQIHLGQILIGKNFSPKLSVSSKIDCIETIDMCVCVSFKILICDNHLRRPFEELCTT